MRLEFSDKNRWAPQQGQIVVVANPVATLVAPFPIRREVLRSAGDWQESVPWSICLDKVGTADDQQADVPGAIARVDWGTGGATHFAYVDWRHGQRFVVTGAALTLELQLLNPSDWGVLPAGLVGWPVTFRASMTPGEVPQLPARCGPTLTVALAGPVDPGNQSDWVTIPPFARVMRFSGRRNDSGAMAGYMLWHQGSPLAPGAQCRLDRYATGGGSGLMEWDQELTIPPDANIVRYQPDGVAPGGSVTMMRFAFELAL